MKINHNTYPCPQCEEMADRIERRLIDRAVSLFTPVKRYKCHFCDWTATVPDKNRPSSPQRLAS